jgi:hypothetical protein
VKLLKQATEQYNLDNSKQIVYENVHFPLGFVVFLDALEIHHLIPANYVSESCETGFVWCDTRRDGGVRIETSSHPLTHDNHTESVLIEGVDESLDIVKKVMQQHGVTTTAMLYENVLVSDLTTPKIIFPNVDLAAGKQVFQVDNNPVYAYDGGVQTLLILKVNDEPAAYVTYSKMTLHGYTYNYLDRAFTESKFSSRGLALKMIVELRRHTNIKILGDEEVTSAGRDMWIRLQKILQVKVIDLETGATHEFTDIPIDDIFVDNIKNNKYLVFIEQLSYMQNLIVEQQGYDYGILKPYNYAFIEKDEILKNI